MKNIVWGLLILGIASSICLASWTYDYNPTATVTSGAVTHIDMSALGATNAIYIINDSATHEVYVNFDGRATNEAEVLSFGYRLDPGESQFRSFHTEIGPKLAVSSGEAAAVRLGITL